jgi:hypothetical protein
LKHRELRTRLIVASIGGQEYVVGREWSYALCNGANNIRNGEATGAWSPGIVQLALKFIFRGFEEPSCA